MLEENGIPSFPPYESPKEPPEGFFRLTTGKTAVHTQGTSLNNPYLNKFNLKFSLDQHDGSRKLGIKSGNTVEILADGVAQTIKAYVTDFIHPSGIHFAMWTGDPSSIKGFKKGHA